MTALVFALQDDQICVAMDTLVVSARDKMPLYFQRKFLSLPGSNLIVAGTGHAGFITGCFQYLQAHFQEATIDDLDGVVPDIFRASVRGQGGLSGLTATIYHFGYSVEEQRYVGYAYRSEHDFRSDRLRYGLGFKPVVPVTPTNDIHFPDFLIELVLEQQRQDNLLPITERVGIGGEIEFVVMSDRLINVETVHRFSSYEAESIYIEQRTEA
ncbi:hypothetical protein HBH1_03366 [Herbaspirillum sp. BH-1]|uniref:Proteasome subunit beta n=1 Tax=Herbaspirillum frisingense TaxID=92645 RepID=A0ABU1PF72_9BURK|nr:MULTISPECIES: hypothetical protein [Herbaspirillum]MDR6584551.1 hypothetical protein [Herbaspirillum frisingense]PLY58300.1 hypothetical protein HBH1_03366 [Herbaspirillum sp. BH-1]